MELHTLGVDAGYTQQDVIEMAKCLTGWTVHAPRKDPDFFFDDRIHTQGKKVVLGRTFNYGGMKDGEEALKMLASDPSTAKFISTKLARHFVSDNPPPVLVDRMAETYRASNGDIRAVLKTMIYSPEFWSKEAYRAKVKQPFELAASTARALGAEVDVTLPLAQWVGRMGEPLFQAQPPTGYSDKSETWVNTGALLNRLNFALALSSNKVPGTKSDLQSLLGQDADTDPHKALSRALTAFLDDQVAQQTQSDAGSPPRRSTNSASRARRSGQTRKPILDRRPSPRRSGISTAMTENGALHATNPSRLPKKWRYLPTRPFRHALIPPTRYRRDRRRPAKRKWSCSSNAAPWTA